MCIRDSLAQPLDRRAVDFRRRVQGAEIFLYDVAEVSKAFAQAGEAALHGIANWRAGDVREAIRLIGTHRTQAEKAAVAEQELQVGQPSRTNRREAAPHHLFVVHGRWRIERELSLIHISEPTRLLSISYA